MSDPTTRKAEKSQHRNDVSWSIYDLDDGSIRWTGYNDGFWWTNVADSEQFVHREGEKTGRLYTLNPHTCEVTITAPTGETTCEVFTEPRSAYTAVGRGRTRVSARMAAERAFYAQVGDDPVPGKLVFIVTVTEEP